MADCFQCAGPASNEYVLAWEATRVRTTVCGECIGGIRATEWIEVAEPPTDGPRQQPRT